MIEPTSLERPSEAGVTSTFEDFFMAEHERLFKALYMLTGNRDEADDLAQEALLRAYERWDRVGGMDSPAGYVYRTALNLHRNRLRGLVVRARRVFAAVPAEDLSGRRPRAKTFGTPRATPARAAGSAGPGRLARSRVGGGRPDAWHRRVIREGTSPSRARDTPRTPGRHR